MCVWGFHITDYDKVLFQAIILTCYWGCFRIAELINVESTAEHAVLVENVYRIYKSGMLKAIRLTLHSHKYSGNFIPDIQLDRKVDDRICPVNAIMQYARFRPKGLRQLFLSSTGKCVNRKWFAGILSTASLKLGYDKARYSTHSLTVGAARHGYKRGNCYTNQDER